MTTQTSGGSAFDRAEEARRIVNTMGLGNMTHRMNPREEKFVNEMILILVTDGDKSSITPKQLFWLRDLKDKYLS
jgi:hypothetical protein